MEVAGEVLAVGHLADRLVARGAIVLPVPDVDGAFEGADAVDCLAVITVTL